MSKRRKIYILVWIAYFVLILFLSFANFEGLIEDSQAVIPFGDKIVHFLMYAFLAAFGVVYIYITNKPPKYMIFYVLGVIIVSGIIELIQPAFNRTADILDFLANAGGAVFGAAMVFAIKDVIDYFDDMTNRLKRRENE